ncbi:hypothetical protein K2173_016250 [Erythroxylum novogranatense]|uniref:beta-galactosidase n=1 Tax=Erythroxylum novogranatense TaxID=1862640 RepID=A0AAV8SGD3_9ROSI|nr:hypothetical protein K2173_016250 [Erythroxylum novogranatense]
MNVKPKMPSSWMKLILITSIVLVCSYCSAGQVDYDVRALIINGQRKLIISGSIHYTRSTPEMWPDLIRKAKDGGLDAISSFIFWNAHEPQPNQYNFRGNLDFVRFFKLVQQAGLYGILQIGPYISAEWNFGGLPLWLLKNRGIKFRTDSDVFKTEMQRFTTHIVNMARYEKLFASQGGPIILAQIESDYGNTATYTGDAGRSYLEWAAKMANAQNIGVPWIMSDQSDISLPSVINTFNGYYGHQFSSNDPFNIPKIWTGAYTGWYQSWGDAVTVRTPEDLAYAVARFFQAGGVVQNYYMYHGGTNFGRSAGKYVTTSFDFNAPIDEYGNLNQPTWDHLKQLHEAIKVGEKILTSKDCAITRRKIMNGFQGGVELTTFAVNSTGERFCFLSNTLSDPEDVDLEPNVTIHVLPWSVSIIQDCNKQIFNTAMVREGKLAENDNAYAKLSWSWREEYIQDQLQGRGTQPSYELLDQKTVTNDQTDYLWYMTSFDNDEDIIRNVTLSVNVTGNAIYAFLNGIYLGTQSDYHFFRFEKPASLNPGKNNISLLTATVGLRWAGGPIEALGEGIDGGPVKLIDGYQTVDLTAHQWNYKVGLNGETEKLYDPKTQSGQWLTNKLPVGSYMTWYKGNFEAPPGTEPVTLDLQGMGKGQAWVNGNGIGRYWVAAIAPKDGCEATCNYIGTYGGGVCHTGCGQPSQRC